MQIVYLSRADVEALAIPMERVVDVVIDALKEKARGDVQMPPKTDLHPRENSFLHAMPAHLPDRGGTGIKWVSGYPRNPQRGLPYISGLVVMNDSDTGIPTGVLDASWITAVRTGACTAATARALARPQSEVLAILGCGVQGRTNAEALRVVLPGLQAIKCFDIVRANADAYAREIGQRLNIAVTVCESPEQAVRGADIIVTAGPIEKPARPAIEGAWLKDGVLAVPLDFDSYFRPDAFARSQSFYTDDCSQLDHFRTLGYFAKVPPVTREIAHVLAGKDAGRTSPSQIIFSINLGIGLLDIALAAELLLEARRQGIGKRLPL